MEKNIIDIRFANGTVLLAESEEELQELVNVGAEESKRKGLSLNAGKQLVRYLQNKELDQIVNCNWKKIQSSNVDGALILGGLLTAHSKCDSEMNRRIILSKVAFGKWYNLLQTDTLQPKLKLTY